MQDQSIVRLKITSLKMTSGEIASATGIEFDRHWMAGERRGPTAIIERTNGAILNVMSSENLDIDVQLVQLFDRLRPHQARIRNLSDTCDIEISCVIYSSSRPALHFSRDIIQSVSELGAGLDIDLYVI
ncbi:MAG: DUF4279 domain-containing protein [Pirellulaceae bacterium]